jgi:RNA polymerase sigma factor (sigma-70 family)
MRPQSSPAADVDHDDDRIDRYLAEIAPLLKRVVAKVCPSSLGIRADELEQEVRIRLWRVLADEKTAAPGASYVYRTAATAAIDAVRRIRARREEELNVARVEIDASSGAVAPAQVARRAELKQVLQRAIEQLNRDQQRAVRLHLQGLTTDEIARALDWTEPKARNTAYRGLAELRHALKALGVERAAD